MSRGTGARGVQIFPRGKKYTDHYDLIFRPSSGSKTDGDKLPLSEEKEDDD